MDQRKTRGKSLPKKCTKDFWDFLGFFKIFRIFRDFWDFFRDFWVFPREIFGIFLRFLRFLMGISEKRTKIFAKQEFMTAEPLCKSRPYIAMSTILVSLQCKQPTFGFWNDVKSYLRNWLNEVDPIPGCHKESTFDRLKRTKFNQNTVGIMADWAVDKNFSYRSRDSKGRRRLRVFMV